MNDREEGGAGHDIERHDARESAPHERPAIVGFPVAIEPDRREPDDEAADDEEEIDADPAGAEHQPHAGRRKVRPRRELDHVVDEHQQRGERAQQVDVRKIHRRQSPGA
jgi:hypothetical protein